MISKYYLFLGTVNHISSEAMKQFICTNHGDNTEKMHLPNNYLCRTNRKILLNVLMMIKRNLSHKLNSTFLAREITDI